jgi:hypothetical protein
MKKCVFEALVKETSEFGDPTFTRSRHASSTWEVFTPVYQ